MDTVHRRAAACGPSAQFARNFTPSVLHYAEPRAAHARNPPLAPMGRPAVTAVAVPAKPDAQPRSPHRRAAPLVCAALPAAAAATLAEAERSLTVQCRVVVPHRLTTHGQQLVLVGGCEALGSWDVNKGVRFTWCEGHSHEAEVELPIHSCIACKLVVLGDNGAASWEPDANRELLLAPTSLASRAAGYTVVCHWGFPEATQVVANALRRGNVAAASRSPPHHLAAGGNKANGQHHQHHQTHHQGAGNALFAGVKKALAQAGSKVISGIASWEEEGQGQGQGGAGVVEEEEEDTPLVQCQVTVLVPKTGPKLGPDQSLVLVGSSPALGRWDPADGLPLERVGEEGSPLWVAHCELPLGEGLQAKVVVVDAVSGKAQTWEPCENRPLARLRGPRPVMVTAYWGLPATHCLEVDRLAAGGAAAGSNTQVVQLLRQQLAATSSQLDGLRRERDDAKKAIAASEQRMQSLETEVKSLAPGPGRQEMVQLAQQLQTTRRLYEATKREAAELGGSVGVTRQLCDAAKRELAGLAAQLDAARAAYEALAPEVEKMERRLASTSRALDATRPEIAALETQLERARGLFDRTLRQIEAAKSLTGSGEFDPALVRRRTETRLRELQFAKS